MATLTVFTPTFNRAYSLPGTYRSLCEQDCKDFVWLIVDDGSSDGTDKLVADWQSSGNGFEIRYIYRENGGMHAAHNTAYENIDTELNVCIDSDDEMAPGAVGKILRKWEQVRNLGYAGIVALDAEKKTGSIIGTAFGDINDTTLTGFYLRGGLGDKKLIYRTDVINSVPPYPVFEGEKYLALAYKYRLIDEKYRLAVLDEVVCLVEYLADGSTKNMFRQYVRNPKGFAFWRKVCMEHPESIKRLFMDTTHYVSSSIIAKNRHYVRESPRKFLTVLLTPAGALETAYIRRQVRKMERKISRK